MSYSVKIFGREVFSVGRDVALAAAPKPDEAGGSVLSRDMGSVRYRWWPTQNTTDTGLRYACGRAIANRFASLRYDVGALKSGKFTAIPDHPFHTIWRAPNPAMNGSFMRRLLARLVVHDGKCFILVIRDRTGRPLWLWPLATARVTVKWGRTNSLEYEYRLQDGGALLLPGDEVLYFRDVHEGDYLDGYGPGNASELLAAVDAHLWGYERDMFQTGVFNRWVVSYPREANITPEDALALSEAWGERARDDNRKLDPMIANNGASFDSFSVGNDVTGFAEMNDIIERRIRQIYGTPRGVLGDTDALPRANLEGSLVVFNEVAVKPLCDLVDEELERVLLPMYDPRLIGEFENPVPGDKEFELREREAMIRARALTPNEWRADEGRDPLEGGDEVVTLVQGIPVQGLTQPVVGQISLEKQEPEDDDEDDDEDEDEDEDAEARRASEYALFLAVQDPAEKSTLAVVRRQFRLQEEEILRRLEREVPRALARFASYSLARMQAEFNAGGSIVDRISNLDEFKQPFVGAVKPGLVKLYAGAGKRAAKKFGVSFEVDTGGIEQVGNHLEKSADSILTTASDRIKASLREGFEKGEGLGDLQARVRELYDGMSRERAEMIARTETVFPANLGALRGYEQAGVESKEWITTRDGNERDTHAAMDGEVIPIGDEFSVGMDRMLAPGGGARPEENINCRCTIAAIGPGEGEE